MSRYNSIKIDNLDAWSQYGLMALTGGLSEWLALPEMKSPFIHNWEDESGIEVDLQNVYVKEQNVSMHVIFVAGSQVEFWDKYSALQAKLASPGLRTIYCRELEKEFQVYFVKCSNVSQPTKLRDTNKVIVQMTLNFIIPNPAATVDTLIRPASITITAPTDIIGYGSFSYQVLPAGANQKVRTWIKSGPAYISGNLIYAGDFGTVVLRVESVADSRVYREVTIEVFFESTLTFGSNSDLISATPDGNTILTAY